MTQYKEVLRLNHLGISGRSIASSLEVSRNTVAKTLKRASEQDLTWPAAEAMSDKAVSDRLFPEKKVETLRKSPDCAYLHKELAKSHVTLSLLWEEYCEQCRISGEIPYMYTQFCKHYRDYAQTTKATMRITHKPGERLEVDWAGKTATIVDETTGELIKVYIFVASLPYSSFTYVEGFTSMNMESWITAHVNAFKFFSGLSKVLVPDNERASRTQGITGLLSHLFVRWLSLRDTGSRSVTVAFTQRNIHLSVHINIEGLERVNKNKGKSHSK